MLLGLLHPRRHPTCGEKSLWRESMLHRSSVIRTCLGPMGASGEKPCAMAASSDHSTTMRCCPPQLQTHPRTRPFGWTFSFNSKTTFAACVPPMLRFSDSSMSSKLSRPGSRPPSTYLCPRSLLMRYLRFQWIGFGSRDPSFARRRPGSIIFADWISRKCSGWRLARAGHRVVGSPSIT